MSQSYMKKEEAIFLQIKTAYLAMANEARYRPAAPSDGLGNITVPVHELNLEKEQSDYAHDWWEEEEERCFALGCCDFITRPVAIFAVEAVRNLNAGIRGTEPGLKLLEMALQHLKAYMTTDVYRRTIRRINSRVYGTDQAIANTNHFLCGRRRHED